MIVNGIRLGAGVNPGDSGICSKHGGRDVTTTHTEAHVLVHTTEGNGHTPILYGQSQSDLNEELKVVFAMQPPANCKLRPK